MLLLLAKVTKETAANAKLDLLLALIIGVLGIAVVFMLLISWRRYNTRLNRPPTERATLEDTWQAAADRLKPDNDDEDDDDETEPDDESALGR